MNPTWKTWRHHYGLVLVIEVEVSKVDKAALRTDLELLDTSYTSLFQDVHGFSQSQGASFPLRQLKTPQWFLIQGNHSFQEGNYSDAIRAYSECVELAPEVSELYFQRANARSACGEFPEAIQDYTHAINHKRFPFLGNALAKVSSVRHPFLHLIHFNRGNARAELSDIEGASSDYSESIRLEPSLMREGYFNRGNIHLDSMRLSEAIEDYDHAIAQGHKGALFNKGNALVMLGRFDEAIECYKLLEQQGAHMASHIVNRIALEDVTDRIRDNHYKVQFKKEEESGYPNLAQLVVHIDGYGYEPEIINGHKYIWNRLFKGRVGNTGGFGWKGLPPGKGSEGKEGFILTIELMARGVKEE